VKEEGAMGNVTYFPVGNLGEFRGGIFASPDEGESREATGQGSAEAGAERKIEGRDTASATSPTGRPAGGQNPVGKELDSLCATCY
jgi:hypothetical protein